MNWRLLAACRGEDPAIFFPHDGAGIERARCICGRCPVQRNCLEYALNRGENYGVWGGESERQRARIRRRRRSRMTMVVA